MPKQHENDPAMNGDGYHKISAEIGGLKASVEMMMNMWRQQEAQATAGRRALHEKFELFQTQATAQLQTLGLRVDRLVDTMTKIEPAVKKYEDEKLRQEGAKRLGTRLYAAMGAAAGGLGWGLHEFFTWWKTPH